ncbi:Survival of motor neuron-related-splicing factor 30 [Smittium culicis]|uniref:Survival of motor neuron-related-splicing factor 30 n=1 Tax=Smittium culicis TaxID=133412 RepID=A0A1R1Y3J6_9FUNG|nr:Survival of motor neuron-related-splicing factor 30 [Smittium culicis]
MDSSEISLYKSQLLEIDLALKADPENTDLLGLKKEIQDLLDLTSSLVEEDINRSGSNTPNTLIKNREDSNQTSSAGSSPKTSNSFDKTNNSHTPTSHIYSNNTLSATKWMIGDDCAAKYSADNKFYPAKIVEITSGNSFKVTFVGYGNSELVNIDSIRTLSSLKPKPNKYSKATPEKRTVSETKGQEVPTDILAPGQRPMKKKKSGSKNETVEAQKSWLAFTKSNKKKKAAPINSSSIFKSPETIEGRVGVIGSGRTMTQFSERIKYR